MKVTAREQLRKGQRVHVLIYVTPQIVKRKPAKVLDVVRKAATLEFDDGEIRKVRFSEIEIDDEHEEDVDVKQPLKASIGERVALSGRRPEPGERFEDKTPNGSVWRVDVVYDDGVRLVRPAVDLNGKEPVECVVSRERFQRDFVPCKPPPPTAPSTVSTWVRASPPPPRVAEPAAAPLVANDEFRQWVAMGKEMLKPLEEKLAELNEEESALQDRLKEIAAERAATKAKHDQIARVIGLVT